MSFDQHVQLARVNALRKFGRWTDVAVVCAALAVAMTSWPEIDHVAMLAWLGCMVFVSGIRIWLSWRTDGDIDSISTAAHWQKLFLVLTVLLGVAWGSAGWMMFRTGSLQQEVMLLVWRKAERYDPAQANAATWIFTIARNKRIDKFRRERHLDFDPDDPTLAPEPEQSPDRRLESAQEARKLSEAITTLPEEQASLLKLAFYEGKSHSIIATEVGLPLGTVKSRLRLALARLRTYLGDDL